MNARRWLALLLLSLAAESSADAADVVRWVDSAGVTHYAEQPPPGVKAVRIERALVPDAASQQQAASDAKRLIQASKRMEAERTLEQAKQVPDPAAQRNLATRVKRCDHARYQLALLSQPIPVFRTASGGERIYLDDSARPAQVQFWREEERTQCDAATLEASAAEARRRSEAVQRPACKDAMQRAITLEATLPRASEKDIAQARQAARSACA